jgi:hypothetical protein
MKHSQVVGFLLALVVLGTCFFPWVIIESKQLTISGFHTKGTNFGRPGLFIFFTAGLSLLFFLINKIWAKRLNVFITTFCFTWSVSKYLMLSAVLADDYIMMNIKPGEHGSTYGGNPLACAVAISALTVLKEEHMAENASSMGQLLRDELAKLHSPFIKTIRGKGLLNAIVINHPNPEAAWDFCLILKEKGLLAKPTHGDKIRFAPPLLITKEQVIESVQKIESALIELNKIV